MGNVYFIWKCESRSEIISNYLSNYSVGLFCLSVCLFSAPGNSPTPGNPPVTSPPPLCYKDVFLLTHGDDLHDTDSSGSTSQEASGLLQGLREAGVPVSVLNSNDTRAVADVATMAHDQVVAANSHTVSGLERPLVVWVQGDAVTADESVGRLHAMSRSTAQLVWVKRPP